LAARRKASSGSWAMSQRTFCGWLVVEFAEPIPAKDMIPTATSAEDLRMLKRIMKTPL